MDYIPAAEAARRWGVTDRQVQRLLAAGRIPGAQKFGVSWMIPADSGKPADLRATKRAPRQKRAEPPVRDCPMLALTTLYSAPGTAEEALLSLSYDADARRLFAAQLAYFQGQPERAAELSRALLRETGRFHTRLGCLCNMANAAVYLAAYPAWQEARFQIAQTPCGDAREEAIREMCLAAVDSALYDRRGYPEWLRIGCFDPLPVDAFPAARYYFAKHLAISRTSPDTVVLLEPLCAQTRAEGAVLAELYLRLVTAIGYHDGGDHARAAFHINRAFDLALPDRLYAPLAEARKNLGVAFDTCLRARSPEAFRAVCRLWERLIPAWTALYERRMARTFAADLTLREHEVAKYAASGLTNDEIAARMHLSVGTVKSHISAALHKAGLHDRGEFAAYLSMS